MTNLAEIIFFVGDKKYTVRACDVSPTTTLNSFLRDHLHFTGTKKMCLEGGCGSCLVAVEKNVDGKLRTFSVNSCLVSVLSCHGWKINTVESIGGPVKGYNEIQELLAKNDGTQCGYCSPGMVMNMYALNKDGPKTMAQIEDSFGGNLCRCTGYRPILSAFKKLGSDAPDAGDAVDAKPVCCGSGTCCTSIEDLSESTAALDLERSSHPPIVLNMGDSRWVKVYNLADLLRTIGAVGDGTYRLIAGNTMRGVYKNEPAVDTNIDISSVNELLQWRLDADTLSLGGAKSMNRAIEILRDTSSDQAWKYLSTVADHINQIAGFSVRNFATLAGSLMVKYIHHEFPSDLFVVLETFDAKIVIVDVNRNEIRLSPQEFLSTSMDKKVIKAIELFRMVPASEYKYATYKIMPRAQNAHAMVNAGFLIQTDASNLVTSARIVYGAINEQFIHASRTESFLLGKNLFTNEVLQGALQMLDSEIEPTETPPDSSAQYRKELALGLFYKCVLKHAPADAIDERYVSGGNILERPLSTSRQEFGINLEDFPVGLPVHKLEGLSQTSGQAEYVADKPDLPNQLHAAFTLTDAPPQSKITSVDITAAVETDGVLAVYLAKDFPGQNNFIPSEIDYPTREKVLCEDVVEYHSQPVAIAVAVCFEIALKAAAKVKVSYEKSETIPLLTIDDVLNAGDEAKDRIIPARSFDAPERGNDVVEVLTGFFFMGQKKHFHMEVQCCNIVPTDNGITIYPSSQWMDLAQISAAQALNIPNNKISVFVKRLGGAFGAKISRNAAVSTAATLAAYKLQRPVKMWLPLETNFEAYGGRYPTKVVYEAGVNSQGVIQYVNTSFYTDGGVGVGNDPCDFAIAPVIGNAYRKNTWSYKIFNVKTDTPTSCYMRAPGLCEGIGASEAILEHIAYALNLDPWEVRLANYDSETHPLLQRLIDTITPFGEIETRQNEIAEFNRANRWRKKGMSVVPMAYNELVLPKHGVLVSIFHGDGSVGICHSGIEIGQGINTKAVQACAFKLGIDMELITVYPSYNQATANTNFTGASIASEMVVYNILRACDILLERMEPIKQTLTNPTWKELVQACYHVNLDMTVETQQSVDLASYNIYGVCAAEVEVDILTGQMLISRVDIVEDIGDSLSPLIDIGQAEGAFVMGIGHYIQEQIILNQDGKLLTPNTWDYKIPGAKDIPVNFRIKFLENNPNPIGVLRSKAIGEPPLCLAIAIPLAIRRALLEARREVDGSDHTWIPIDGATTVEKTLLFSSNSYENYVLN